MSVIIKGAREAAKKYKENELKGVYSKIVVNILTGEVFVDETGKFNSCRYRELELPFGCVSDVGITNEAERLINEYYDC